MLKGAISIAAIPTVARAAMRVGGPTRFPPGFVWGASTSAPQIEGAWREDGRGESTWDRFAHHAGRIKGGATADIACDSYHRYAEDVALVATLNLKSYRFSVAWPRIQADGRGPANPRGMDYYKRVADACRARGITPTATLYHWDLPQALEAKGGWAARDTAERFRDYAEQVGLGLKDHVRKWGIFEEPKTFIQCGYWYGIFAPGLKDPLMMLRASHVANLAQGMGFQALKAIDPRFEVGSDFDVSPALPKTNTSADHAAAARWFKFLNLWYLEPALTGRYPEGVLDGARQADLLGWRDGDAAKLRAAFDYVALNYYASHVVRHEVGAGGIPGLDAASDYGAGPHEKTEGGLDIDPPRFRQILGEMRRTTGAIPIEIAEIGVSCAAPPDGLHDAKRIAYLRAHLVELRRAIDDGVPVRACHVWSLIDNFEWLLGYSSRYGLVSVDFPHGQRRTIKDSGRWYAGVARANAVT